MPEYPTIDMIALAFAAQRVNGRMIKHNGTVWDIDTNTKTEEKANKQIMYEHLSGQHPITVLEQDYENAREAVDLLVNHRVMMTLQDQRITPFMHALVDSVQKETVSKLGLIAYVPEQSTKITLKQIADSKLQTVVYTSQHLGTVGQRMEFSIKVLSSKFVQQFGCYFVFGYTPDDNCVGYFTKHESLTKDGYYVGKVKRHNIDKYRNDAKVTEFNFVKAVDPVIQTS